MCYLQEIKTQIRKTINSKDDNKDLEREADENFRHDTVFGEILNSNLPPEELTLSRLQDEAVIIITAGIGPTKTTMTIACFHVLNNPSIYQQLYQELVNAFPDPAMQPTLPELEKLPYLAAVIQECKIFILLSLIGSSLIIIRLPVEIETLAGPVAFLSILLFRHLNLGLKSF